MQVEAVDFRIADQPEVDILRYRTTLINAGRFRAHEFWKAELGSSYL
jgi:hypothetical protein